MVEDKSVDASVISVETLNGTVQLAGFAKDSAREADRREHRHEGQGREVGARTTSRSGRDLRAARRTRRQTFASAARRAPGMPASRRARRVRAPARSHPPGARSRAGVPLPRRVIPPAAGSRDAAIRNATKQRARSRCPGSSTIPRSALRCPGSESNLRTSTAIRQGAAAGAGWVRASIAPWPTISCSSSAARNSSRSGPAQRSCSSSATESSGRRTSHCGWSTCTGMRTAPERSAPVGRGDARRRHAAPPRPA